MPSFTRYKFAIPRKQGLQAPEDYSRPQEIHAMHDEKKITRHNQPKKNLIGCYKFVEGLDGNI